MVDSSSALEYFVESASIVVAEFKAHCHLAWFDLYAVAVALTRPGLEQKLDGPRLACKRAVDKHVLDAFDDARAQLVFVGVEVGVTRHVALDGGIADAQSLRREYQLPMGRLQRFFELLFFDFDPRHKLN